VAEALAWGLLAGSSLVIGALVALVVPIRPRVLGLVMAFGSGVLISAVAFDLVEEAFETSNGSGAVAVGLFAGCAVFFAGDTLIDRMGGADRKKVAPGAQSAGPALAIVLGAVLDGVPESMVIGLTIVQGGSVGAAYVAAVFISNLPEGVAATTGLVAGGWTRGRILGLWLLVVAVSGIASAAGYVLLDGAAPGTVAFVLAFAGGAILTMLADTMMPEAFKHGRELAGVATTLGFAAAFALHTIQ
jgi:zinc transporter, ZIP family